MRWIVRIFALALALLVLVIGGSMLASESGEVVVLHTTDGAGGSTKTRLWVVDDGGGRAWLRAGSPESTWLRALQRNPAVEVERGGVRAAFLAIPVPEQRERINPLFAAKYGWADAYIALLFGRDDATPIRLEPR